MLQLEASLRRGALSRDWDPLARLAARRAASEALPPVATAPATALAPSPPVKAQPSTPQADASAPGTPKTLSGELGNPYQPPMHAPRSPFHHVYICSTVWHFGFQQVMTMAHCIRLSAELVRVCLVLKTGMQGADVALMLAGTGRSTRERRKVDYKEPSLLDMQASTAVGTADKARAPAPKQETDDLVEYDFKSDSRVVENEATKKAAHWVVNNKSLWARFSGRYRLPQALAKKAARE